MQHWILGIKKIIENYKATSIGLLMTDLEINACP